MSKNKLPWIFLALLFGLACLGLGIRQGMQVGEKNVINKIAYEEKVKSLTPTVIPKPVVITYTNVGDDKCGISYLLPDKMSSEEAKVSIICDKKSASEEAKLKANGYIKKTISTEKSIWLKSEKEQMELIRRTLEETVK